MQLKNVKLMLEELPNVNIASVEPAVTSWLDPGIEVVYTIKLKTGRLEKEITQLSFTVKSDEYTMAKRLFVDTKLWENIEPKFEIGAWKFPLMNMLLILLVGTPLFLIINWLAAQQLDNISEGIVARIFKDTSADHDVARKLISSNRIGSYRKIYVTYATYMKFRINAKNLKMISLNSMVRRDASEIHKRFGISLELATLIVFSRRRKLVNKFKQGIAEILTNEEIPQLIMDKFSNINFIDPFGLPKKTKETGKKQMIADERLVRFIDNARKFSLSDAEICSRLAAAGWKQKEIEATMKECSKLESSFMRYMRHALLKGESDEDIRLTLAKAGWSSDEIKRNLSIALDEFSSAQKYLLKGLLFGYTDEKLVSDMAGAGWNVDDVQKNLALAKGKLYSMKRYVSAISGKGHSFAAIIQSLKKSGWDDEILKAYLASTEAKQYSLIERLK